MLAEYIKALKVNLEKASFLNFIQKDSLAK